ncbi:MAG: MetQ/NlpA family ABC transporter substrate-binding protein [Oscillibacter sp.]
MTVKLGVVGGIYDDLWASAKAALADEGIDLEIVQFSDYVTPNNALANGEIDLNAFQHRIYLQNEIDNYGYAIQNIGNTFIIPLNLYSRQVKFRLTSSRTATSVAIPGRSDQRRPCAQGARSRGPRSSSTASAEFNPTVDDIDELQHQDHHRGTARLTQSRPSLADVTAACREWQLRARLSASRPRRPSTRMTSVLDVEEYWNLIAARSADLEDADTAGHL